MSLDSLDSRIRKALKSLQTSEYPTVAATAREYGVPYQKLRRRYNHLSVSYNQAHEAQMVLNQAQEREIVRWIGVRTTKGFPPTYALLRARIEAIRRAEDPVAPPLGRNYITRFLKRHLELGAAISQRRNKKRAIVNSKVVYQDFFEKVAI